MADKFPEDIELETQYLTAHPEVKQMVEAGGHNFISGREHYEQTGRQQGFGYYPHETAYLKAHPHVVAAIKGGEYFSAFDYWERKGRYERHYGTGAPSRASILMPAAARTPEEINQPHDVSNIPVGIPSPYPDSPLFGKGQITIPYVETVDKLLDKNPIVCVGDGHHEDTAVQYVANTSVEGLLRHNGGRGKKLIAVELRENYQANVDAYLASGKEEDLAFIRQATNHVEGVKNAEAMKELLRMAYAERKRLADAGDTTSCVDVLCKDLDTDDRRGVNRHWVEKIVEADRKKGGYDWIMDIGGDGHYLNPVKFDWDPKKRAEGYYSMRHTEGMEEDMDERLARRLKRNTAHISIEYAPNGMPGIEFGNTNGALRHKWLHYREEREATEQNQDTAQIEVNVMQAAPGESRADYMRRLQEINRMNYDMRIEARNAVSPIQYHLEQVAKQRQQSLYSEARGRSFIQAEVAVRRDGRFPDAFTDATMATVERAREWNVPESVKGVKATLDWLKANDPQGSITFEMWSDWKRPKDAQHDPDFKRIRVPAVEVLSRELGELQSSQVAAKLPKPQSKANTPNKPK